MPSIKKLYTKKSAPVPPPPPPPTSDSESESESESESRVPVKKVIDLDEPAEYRKFLSKLYPRSQRYSESKHADSTSESDTEYTDYDEEDEEEEEEEEEDKEEEDNKHAIKQTIFVLSGDVDDGSESDRSDSVEENEDESVSSDDSDDDDDDEESEKAHRKQARQEARQVAAESRAMLPQLRALPPSSTVDKHIRQCERKIAAVDAMDAKKTAKQVDKNSRIFKRLLKEQDRSNESRYYKSLSLEKQRQLIKEMREIRRAMCTEKPYRIQLLESSIPVALKAEAMRKIDALDGSDPGYGEYSKLKGWIDTFMQIPFGVECKLPVSVTDGVDACHAFMERAQQTLDDAVYGLDDTKSQVMQLVGQLITNPAAVGCSIALNGPPGTGKTTLLKDGVSKILGRPFAFIALGGATDSSFLEGSTYVYEGSMCGRIVQIMIESKCMNPLIFMDELDKISETPKGEEIANILLHLTDSTQNMQFHEKYFSGVPFDLSRCIFVFSYNDESRINPVLLDRMYKIRTKGYSGAEKQIIATQHLLPRIRELVRFGEDDIVLSKDVLGFIIDNFCGGEEGARNLKRCLEIIHTKLNLYRLMRLGTSLSDKHKMTLQVTFPFTVTRDIVSKLLPQATERTSMNMMYV